MNIVLSMTSYGDRLQNLHKYLNWVKYIRYDFNLYIGEDQIIPKELNEFFNKVPNAMLHRCKDIGPLTKCFYALQDFPNDVIFMLDDDLYYTPEWINFAIDSYICNQNDFYNCVISLVARKILFSKDGGLEIMQYLNDQSDYQKQFNHITGHAIPRIPSYRNILMSGCPGSFLNINQLHEDFFDYEKYIKLSKSQDEIWIWAQSIRKGYKHVCLHHANIALQQLPNTAQYGLNINYNSIEHEHEIFNKIIKEYPNIMHILNID